MKKTFNDCGVIARYREFLPVTDATPVISLSEGSTPLIHSPKLSAITGGEVYLKYEGLNPTGSFKDRGMTMAISKAAEAGAHTVLCASTGNTSAAAAAYAARAGMKCAVLLPAGRIAGGKMVQAYIYGATVIAIRGNFDDALRLVRELGETGDFAIVNSINPYRIEGQKTAAFERVYWALRSGPEPRLREVIAGLPQLQREILDLRFQHDLSYAEIAEVLDIKHGTVMSRLSRARGRLLEVMNGDTSLMTDA
jgi:threonine synthase